MTGYLTRRHNGDYLLTRGKPITCRVTGTEHDDAYIKAGEPVGVQMCASGVHAAMGAELNVGETRKVTYILQLKEQ